MSTAPLAGKTVACTLALLALALVAAPVARGQAGANASSLRTIAIDERLAADAGLRLGQRVTVTATPGATGDTVIVP